MDNLTVLVPFRNGWSTIRRLLDSLPKSLPVIVVDDCSDVPLGERDLPGATIIRHLERGYFTGAVNTGINACATDVLILNQDVHFENDQWLSLLEQKEYGLIGEGIAGAHPAWPNGYIHGTFMFIRREVIKKIGLMNANVYPLWGSTCEYQLRACRAGFKALPKQAIPGFVHRSKEQKFGSSIQKALEDEPGKRDLFIRTPPEISVIIPCYNYGRYLKDALDSLMAQTFQSFEVIIVDDASRDNSFKIAQSLADPWKGIRVIRHQQNKGTAAALNTGIQSAYGRYISILSADDMMKPNRLANFYKLQLENPHSFIYDDLVLFGREIKNISDEDVKRKGLKRIGSDIVFPLEYDFEKLVKKNGVHAGIFYPKAAWQEVGGYPGVMGQGREDWAFNVALGIKGWCGVKAGEPGYLYRRDGQNRTLTNTNHIHRQNFQETMIKLFPAIYRGERPMGCCGGSKSTFKNGGSKVASKQSASLPGKGGFEILEYIGTSTSDMTWTGPATHTQYYLGGNRRVGYVDINDAVGMLKMADRNGRPVFRVYRQPKQQEIKLVQPKPVEAVVVSQPEVVTEAATVKEYREWQQPVLAEEKPRKTTARKSTRKSSR